jgi:4-hydroxy-3-methylbut-2-enyl diphosphate reductase
VKVEIDKNSGFCTGVVNAIRLAEKELKEGALCCIGDIVHNNLEMERLRRMGLQTIDQAGFSALKNARVMFRAHGEPPVSYATAEKNGVQIIDASCPVVLNLQRKIRQAYRKIRPLGGTVVIYGKKGHAEVVGLEGQAEGHAVVVETESDLEQLDLSRPVTLFSQTTQSLEGFGRMAERLVALGGTQVEVHDTICRKVANRIPQLENFAGMHDVVIFVSGKKSSNGKQLYAVCKRVNPRSYLVERADDLREEMWCGAGTVGISGATSTPFWVMEEIRRKIE